LRPTRHKDSKHKSSEFRSHDLPPKNGNALGLSRSLAHW
jgi:hypothetical protein